MTGRGGHSPAFPNRASAASARKMSETPQTPSAADPSLDAGAKASVLIEALPYLRRYAGRTFVVKYGGHAMGDHAAAASFAQDIVLLKASTPWWSTAGGRRSARCWGGWVSKAASSMACG